MPWETRITVWSYPNAGDLLPACASNVPLSLLLQLARRQHLQMTLSLWEPRLVGSFCCCVCSHVALKDRVLAVSVSRIFTNCYLRGQKKGFKEVSNERMI